MKTTAVRAVLCLGVVYLIAGLVFGALAGQAASHQMVVAWRWAAWVVSAIAFGGHIVYEQVRLRSSPTITALHVSSAAGLGAFGLAVAANVHAQAVAPGQYSLILVLSLAIWPVMTALPAFVVALVSATLLARARRNGPA
ncbi:MAG TPA: hypothetical protein VF173_17565 [Thermoanaerobaculia bacterium]|nr:hypothetical protein [Thermoanaerobaculia bacterium]